MEPRRVLPPEPVSPSDRRKSRDTPRHPQGRSPAGWLTLPEYGHHAPAARIKRMGRRPHLRRQTASATPAKDRRTRRPVGRWLPPDRLLFRRDLPAPASCRTESLRATLWCERFPATGRREVLDPGHGLRRRSGRDPGWTSPVVRELRGENDDRLPDSLGKPPRAVERPARFATARDRKSNRCAACK